MGCLKETNKNKTQCVIKLSQGNKGISRLDNCTDDQPFSQNREMVKETSRTIVMI